MQAFILRRGIIWQSVLLLQSFLSGGGRGRCGGGNRCNSKGQSCEGRLAGRISGVKSFSHRIRCMLSEFTYTILHMDKVASNCLKCFHGASQSEFFSRQGRDRCPSRYSFLPSLLPPSMLSLFLPSGQFFMLCMSAFCLPCAALVLSLVVRL